MRPLQLATILIIAELILSLFVIADNTYRTNKMKDVLEDTKKLVSITGVTDLSIATDCPSARNPSMSDGTTCFRDFPGSMCYHASCSGISPPYFYGIYKPMLVEER